MYTSESRWPNWLSQSHVRHLSPLAPTLTLALALALALARCHSLSLLSLHIYFCTHVFNKMLEGKQTLAHFERCHITIHIY